jgi:hypothetical protein
MAWVSEYKPDQSCGGFQLQLLHDVFTVSFYGINTEVELVCYLLIGVLFTDQLYNFYFPFGKVKRLEERGIGVNDFTRIAGPACMYEEDGLNQLFFIAVFNQVPVGAVITGLGDEVRFIIRRKDDNTDTGVELPDVFGSFHSVDERHIDVQQHDVWLFNGEQVQEFLAISCSMHDQEVVFLLQKGTDTIEEKGVIVCDNNFNEG